MSTKTKKKLCWNCEGDVLLTATNCPFCGVSLELAAMEEEKKNKDPFAPPYKLVNNAKESKIPASPYSQATEPEIEETQEAPPSRTDPKSMVLSLAFLLVGAAFAIFGVVLWLFADKTGHLNLRWNAQYWFIYLLLSLPMIYLGWKVTSEETK